MRHVSWVINIFLIISFYLPFFSFHKSCWCGFGSCLCNNEVSLGKEIKFQLGLLGVESNESFKKDFFLSKNEKSLAFHIFWGENLYSFDK